MAEHTPLPWRWQTVHYNAGWTSQVLKSPANDRPILGISSSACSWKPSDADREFILRAVNNHEALLAALKMAADCIEGLVPIEVLDAIAVAEGRPHA